METSTIDQAWYSLALGQLLFSRGKFEEARAHYVKAKEKAPHWWWTLALPRRTLRCRTQFHRSSEVAGRLVRSISETRKCSSDWRGAHGRWRTGARFCLGSQEQKRHIEKAEEAGLLLFLHHQAGMYSDTLPIPARALALARRNASLRTTQNSLDQLAWAQYRAGELEAASETISRALKMGTPTAHVLYHASMIAGATGNLSASKEYLAKASSLNPKFLEFQLPSLNRPSP